MRTFVLPVAVALVAIVTLLGRLPVGAQGTTVPPLVLVSRAIPPQGTIYWSVPRGLPGVGAYSRFEVAAPGRLLVRESNGQIRVLVDGAQPGSTPFRLVDVNAPAVAWNGQQVAFAGLREGDYPLGPMQNPGAWRLYVINLDGSGLRQVTFSDRDALDLSQFSFLQDQFRPYDDSDPAWLPDGRIVFSSTRFPGFGQYGSARASQLYVVNSNGTGLHRITGEKNGADRPLVDPLTGRIVYSRWWRNFRFASDDISTVPAPGGGYRRHLGLLSAADDQLGGVPGGRTNLVRNSWPLGTINPDGTDLQQFAGQSGLFFEGEDDNHAYGGAFAADGSIFANFFPMKNGTEASGFGGIRHYQRGVGKPRHVIGITSNLNQTLASTNPPSYGVYAGTYAAEPEVLPDGRLVVSVATSIAQDYGLYLVNPDGTGLTPLYDEPGRTELRARVAIAAAGAAYHSRHGGDTGRSAAAARRASLRRRRDVHLRRAQRVLQRAGGCADRQCAADGQRGVDRILPGSPEVESGVGRAARLANPAADRGGRPGWVDSADRPSGHAPSLRAVAYRQPAGPPDRPRVRWRKHRRLARRRHELRATGHAGHLRGLPRRPHDDPGAARCGVRTMDQSGPRRCAPHLLD